jgi:hypothetical protein
VIGDQVWWNVNVQPTIPVIFCVDVEPDPRQVNRAAREPWDGYEFTQRYVRDLRPRIEALTGAPAHFSWFLRMDPQVAEPYESATWVPDSYREHMDEIQRAGDEIGVHPHPYRWLENERAWLQDFGNQAWVDRCLRVSLEAFATAFRRPCLSMRFGDRWLNTPTVNLAERLGVRFDLTVEPGAPPLPALMAEERTSGSLPGYRRVARFPFAPSPSDFRRRVRRGARAIRLIPLTSGHLRFGMRHPRRYLRRLWQNGARHRRQDTPLSMWRHWPTPDTFDRMLDRALAAQRHPYLAFAIRTDLGVRADLLQAIDVCVNALLAHPARSRFRFSTPAEALAELEPAG